MNAQEQKANTSDSMKKEIEQALNGGAVNFEEIPDETTSPLNQPVSNKGLAEDNIKSSEQEQQTEQDQEKDSDAPEQDFEEGAKETAINVEMPIAHARMAADTFLGIADNALEVSGGFFVTIRKHKDFYEFDEVVQVIEEQNVKNLRRIKLDEEDKMLLHPLLVIVIQKNTRTLTPEQQLAAAVLSIIVKKVKVMVEIRAENAMLTERIREIIRQEKNTEDESTDSSVHPASENKEAKTATVMEVAD